jgi:hypothetical protein
MTRRPGLGWLAAALCAAGCPGYSSGIRPDATLHPASAYLYGRFYMNALPGTDSIAGGKQSIGLAFRCENGSWYTFGSLDRRDVQVLEIKPSRCSLMKAVMADQNGIVRMEVKATPKVQRPLDFTAGRAHYIGDYFAKGDYSLRVDANIETWAWDMSSGAGDRYAETTAELKRAFPNLASLPTDDLRLLPEAPRKRGNGIGPSPGEPPLSPPVVAALAPLIKLSYATPAQCEAACPTGQCLPYRGPSGPVMTCVIRCNRNADCPTGLACSCPNSETPGPECDTSRRQELRPRVCVTPEVTGQP